jgi:hypothetical protein
LANRSYALGNYHWANADLNWLSQNWKLVGCSSGYVPDTTSSGDEFLTSILSGNRICTSSNLASKTNVGGALDAADPVFTSVTGSTITQFVLYHDTGSAATSQLAILWDTATNLPVVPNGGNITFQFAGAPYYVLAFAFQGLSDKEKSLASRVFDGLREVLGIPFDRTHSGLWIPTPQVVLS